MANIMTHKYRAYFGCYPDDELRRYQDPLSQHVCNLFDQWFDGWRFFQRDDRRIAKQLRDAIDEHAKIFGYEWRKAPKDPPWNRRMVYQWRRKRKTTPDN